jgi:hypothetical protein
MCHEVLTQRNPFCHHVNTKRAAESAFRDACRTSSGPHLLIYLIPCLLMGPFNLRMVTDESLEVNIYKQSVFMFCFSVIHSHFPRMLTTGCRETRHLLP